ncbi:molybdopterin/thiamine biosynthesis adenylyltransferase [Frondihabitans sp. PhB188]|uniref:HesA/MoeB/ThiF family protein n=1 Tax=Frondihabitans sp. PhB188 TaxID=2485200 RepID=UPI000F920DBD|nr:ThiF family adenylyltransferase [Frondihabitans sp. PhB188]ROQ30270.1 molybdopterin/thiamine biosynthesis adenylyltransferase [Frondihabitans sp. PhB188]
MKTSLVMRQEHADRLLVLAQGTLETGAVVLARHVATASGIRLLVTEIHEVPDEAYVRRDEDALEILSEGYMHALGRAEKTGNVALWLHTHPGEGASPRLSTHDHIVDASLKDVFAARTGSGQYGAIVLSHVDGHLTFTGHLDGEEVSPIEYLVSVGDRFLFHRSADSAFPSVPALFDRNIRAFGTEIQALLSDLTVAVVGAGGTGSATAEQLVRLGVRHLILIDPDTLSDSNVTRVYGSTPGDVGKRKIDVLGDHLQAIAPDLVVDRRFGAITALQHAEALLDADIIFGCTDDNAGRLRLSRIPYYYLTPVIDCGVQLDANEHDLITGIFGRVTTLHPSAPCLICRNRVDLALAAAETRSRDEQRTLEKEGYAPALPGVEPAVVAFTTFVAATAVNELLERLIGYGEPPAPSEVILRIHDRDIRATHADAKTGHYCDPAATIQYDDEMFLGLNWTS